MKTQILNTEKIESTNYSMLTNIIELASIPTLAEQNELFGNDGSVVLAF